MGSLKWNEKMNLGHRPLNSQVLKLWKTLAIALMAMGLLGQVWTLGAWNRYATELPHSPNPEIGRVYRLALHGFVVYQTEREHSIYWGVENWSWGIFCVGFAFGLAHQWKSGELKKYF